jgi:hypothetical protein
VAISVSGYRTTGIFCPEGGCIWSYEMLLTIYQTTWSQTTEYYSWDFKLLLFFRWNSCCMIEVEIIVSLVTMSKAVIKIAHFWMPVRLVSRLQSSTQNIAYGMNLPLK